MEEGGGRDDWGGREEKIILRRIEGKISKCLEED